VTAQPPHPSKRSPAPDYGPFGKVPTASGVVYFGEKWGARNGPTVFIILGAFLGVLGLLGLVGGGTGFGISMLAVGVSFVIIGFYNRKKQVHLDFLCDAQGLTVRQSNRQQRALPALWIPWNTVSATRCTVLRVEDQNSDNGVRTSTYIQGFTIDAGGVPAFQTDERTTKGLPAFIDLCNRSVPHLGYRWIPKKSANGLPVMETVYKYAKVPPY